MSAPIVMSKGIVRFYRNDTAKLDRLDDDLREFVTEGERLRGVPFFVPYPPTAEDEAEHKDKQIPVQFLGLDPNGGTTKEIKGTTTLMMLMPLYIKKEGRNIYYIQLKDEFGKIELDFCTQIVQGHQRVKGENNG
jgi:hypothetical protein